MKFDINTERLSLEENPKDKTLKIPLLRQAYFRSGYYGPLAFDMKFFNSLIDNFQAGTVGHDLSVNARHKPDLGALAWVESVTVENGKFIVYAKPTPTGRKLVEDKTYLYASAEIEDPYIDRETGKEYGPTLTGLALTNNPYIHRQDKVTLFSLDEDSSYQLVDVINSPETEPYEISTQLYASTALRTITAARAISFIRRNFE